MSKLLKCQFITKVFLVTCCLALVDRSSNALLLGNFIGCNSFGCRLSALENDVSQLKQQVARLSDPNMSPMNNYRPLNQQGGYNQNQNLNQGFNGNNGNNGNQQQITPGQQSQTQDGQGNPGNRVNYANLIPDYPVQGGQQLRRVNGYQNNLNNQFLRA